MPEKTYTFEELTATAQLAAIREWQQGDYLSYEWWDGVYLDFMHICECLGFDTGTKNIFFALHYGQGDYACFTGRYFGKVTAAAEIQAYAPNDETLYRVGQELTAMQVTQRMLGLELFDVTVHARCISIHDWGVDEIGEPDEERFTHLVEDLNRWLYDTLRREYEYQTSDEVVREQLAEGHYEFTKEGLIL